MLSDAQQQLLHAWVDGQVTEAESRVVMELLTRPEASEYVSELKRLRELVARHAGINAPAGLLDRVRDALRRESHAPLLQLYAWRAAALAAAAAVVITTGVVFGPRLFQQNVRPESVADIVTQPAARAAEDSGQPSPPTDGSPIPDPVVRGGESLKESQRPARSVLRLDRGVDQPLELSVHMDRSREASALQVYNDILIVSSLYGEAELKDGVAADEFAGRDFSEFDGVAVEVSQERLPELIAALNRMAADQAYGEVVVPNDLRNSISSSASEVERMQDLVRKKKESDPTCGARGYLPPELQRECLESELTDRPEDLQRVNAPAEPRSRKFESSTATEDHKIKLMLRLR